MGNRDQKRSSAASTAAALINPSIIPFTASPATAQVQAQAHGVTNPTPRSALTASTSVAEEAPRRRRGGSFSSVSDLSAVSDNENDNEDEDGRISDSGRTTGSLLSIWKVSGVNG
jgi:hypothetical protein